MFPEILIIMAEDLIKTCQDNALTLSLAESCTGGLVAGCVTAVPGASSVFERGFVTYTNQAKTDMLGVLPEVFTEHGAVSEPCARAMAQGALEQAPANLSAAVTGIAGPGGATAGKPVGLVHIAVARDGFETLHERHVFKGDRDRVRIQAVESTLRLLNQMAGKRAC